jgi:hypothetical protein
MHTLSPESAQSSVDRHALPRSPARNNEAQRSSLRLMKRHQCLVSGYRLSGFNRLSCHVNSPEFSVHLLQRAEGIVPFWHVS